MKKHQKNDRLIARSSFRRLSIAIASIFSIIPSLTVGTISSAEAFREYDIKAALIYQVAKFVRWPQTINVGTSLHTCVLGDDPFGPAFDALRGKLVRGRPLTIERLKNLRSPEDRCHILFISRSERSRLSLILPGLQTAPILTIADTEGFAELGGILNFQIDDDRVKFEINVRSSQLAGLQINARLLELATIVDDNLGGGG